MFAGDIWSFIDRPAVSIVKSVLSFYDLSVSGLIIVDDTFGGAAGDNFGGLVEGEGELRRQYGRIDSGGEG